MFKHIKLKCLLKGNMQTKFDYIQNIVVALAYEDVIQLINGFSITCENLDFERFETADICEKMKRNIQIKLSQDSKLKLEFMRVYLEQKSKNQQ